MLSGPSGSRIRLFSTIDFSATQCNTPAESCSRQGQKCQVYTMDAFVSNGAGPFARVLAARQRSPTGSSWVSEISQSGESVQGQSYRSPNEFVICKPQRGGPCVNRRASPTFIVFCWSSGSTECWEALGISLSLSAYVSKVFLAPVFGPLVNRPSIES